LVPAFSSKGFTIKKEQSEVETAVELATPSLPDYLLLSAYDIAHGFVPKLEDLPARPEIVFLDSGGYEAAVDHDLSAAVHMPHEPLEWSELMYEKVIADWPKYQATTFVTYDHPKLRQTFEEQLERARRFRTARSEDLVDFLLKPETTDQDYLTSTLKKALRDAKSLHGFGIIGVTEKELGSSFLARMTAIAELRLALDAAGVDAPIHVFGALDPLTSCLYFLSGAEIFDGLTWLRYGYHEGFCIYRGNYGQVKGGLNRVDTLEYAWMLTSNIRYLSTLALAMRKFALDADFSHFEHHATVLRQHEAALRTTLGRRL